MNELTTRFLHPLLPWRFTLALGWQKTWLLRTLETKLVSQFGPVGTRFLVVCFLHHKEKRLLFLIPLASPTWELKGAFSASYEGAGMLR